MAMVAPFFDSRCIFRKKRWIVLSLFQYKYWSE